LTTNGILATILLDVHLFLSGGCVTDCLAHEVTDRGQSRSR